MTTRWVAFQATVPDWAVADLNRQIAEYSARAEASEQAAAETVEERTRRALGLINSADAWRLLATLAGLSTEQSPTGWVAWKMLCSAMDMDAAKLSGVVGGIEKALKNEPRLFERTKSGDTPLYRVSHEVAQVIFAVLEERNGEPLTSPDH